MDQATPPYVSILAKALEELKQDIKEEGESKSSAWSVVSKDKHCVVKKLVKKGNSLPYFKAIGKLPIPMKDLLNEVLIGQTRRREWNPSFNEQNVIEEREIDGHHYMTYRDSQQTALGGLIGARDFVECRDWFEENGKIWFLYTSYEHPDWPPQPGFIRGKIHPCGYLLEPDPENPNHTITIFTSHIDLGGSLPGYLSAKGISGEMAAFFPRVTAMFKK